MLLSVSNLQVSYDKIKALHGISFQIDEGEIICIIGANGAGKSTTLRAISRVVKVADGTRIDYLGKSIIDYPADKVVSKLGISHVPEGRRLFGNLTVHENLSWPLLPGRTINRWKKTSSGFFPFSPGCWKESPKRQGP